MPKCQSCAANYDDNFRYCPYCGTAKPTPQIVVAQDQSDPRLYEEGVLRLKCIMEKQVVAIHKGWFGGTIEQREPVRIVQIELLARSHDRGEYVALTSASFRHLCPTDGIIDVFAMTKPGTLYTWQKYPLHKLEKPLKSAFDHVYTGKPYTSTNKEEMAQQALFEVLFREQKMAWEGFCSSLHNEGWYSMTDEAIGRRLPRSDKGGWWSILANYPSGKADTEPRDPYKEPYFDESDKMRRYRYRRQT